MFSGRITNQYFYEFYKLSSSEMAKVTWKYQIFLFSRVEIDKEDGNFLKKKNRPCLSVQASFNLQLVQSLVHLTCDFWEALNISDVE